MHRERLGIVLAAVAPLVGCGARTELDLVEAGTVETPTTTSSHTTGSTGPTALCPSDIDTTPLTEVELVGDAVDDGQVVSWHWENYERPSGSSATEPLPGDARVARFTPDVAGEYPMRLTVRDDDGLEDSCEMVVRAIPGETFRVELYWNPPEDPYDPTDVDLHLLHPNAPAWFDYALDCHYANCSVAAGYVLEWDVPAYAADNPRLDLDDVDGYGPENINIDAPVVGLRYTIGVHYFSDDGVGPADAFVKLYCGQNNIDPIFEVGPVPLVGNSSWEYNQFWKVATVVWDGAGCAVTPLDTIVSTQDALAQP